MSRNKDKGTSFETAICRYLRENGWPNVERRALNGNQDKGDIAGLPVVVEAKNVSRLALAEWVEEARTEAANAGVRVGVVWFKRRGTTDPGKSYVLMTGADLVALLEGK